MKNREKGITLIVLVVTIIIMLILVSVTINIVIKGGLIETAQEAKKETEKASEKQEIMSATYALRSNGKKIVLSELETVLNNVSIVKNLEDTNGQFPITITTEKDNVFYIDNDGTILDNKPLPKEWDNTKVIGAVTEIINEVEYNAPIPIGYAVSGATSENTIEQGLVIYQMTEQQKATIDWTNIEEVETAKSTYNQFVWIPINDIQSMTTLQTGSETDYKGLIEGCYNKEPLNLTGRQTFNSETTINGLHISAGDSFLFDSQEMFTIYGGGTYTDTMYQTEFNTMVESVKKYKGFYIGRYETGGYNTSTAVIRAGEGINSTGSVTWYSMYNKTKTLSTNTTEVRIILGSQYDQVLEFAECSNETTPTKNYLLIETGATSTDCYKNIYDLCGNVFDWTQEAFSTSNRVFRGGRYNTSKSANYRGYNSPFTSTNGHRKSCYTLYITIGYLLYNYKKQII